jgi:cytochrome c553
MSGFATALSEEEMEAIAEYFEEQPSTLTVPKH